MYFFLFWVFVLDFVCIQVCDFVFAPRTFCRTNKGAALAEPEVGTARLVGGREDPNGSWAYGRLEVFDGNIFSSIGESVLDQNFGRRGASVACRSLGFSAGAQFYTQSLRAIPNTDTSTDRQLTIRCRGTEQSLADCEIDSREEDTVFDSGSSNSVALVCSNPSGVKHLLATLAEHHLASKRVSCRSAHALPGCRSCWGKPMLDMS